MSAPGGLIVVSPHLDDAVLSVGALIAARVRAGQSVQVWTAFTDRPSGQKVPRRLRSFADYATRIAEDERALALLGASGRRFGLPERLWRDPPARGLRAAFRTPADRSGFGQLTPLGDLAAEAFARPGVQVLAPLGVGNHVDHVEVAVAVLTTALRLGTTDRVGFYEDFYALSDSARRRHPVTGIPRQAPGRQPRRAPGWAAPIEGLVLWATPWFGSGPSLDAYLPMSGTTWRCDAHPVDAWSEQRQLAAIAEYRSQTRALGGIRQLRALLRRSHRGHGGELIWSVQPG